jgi:hypothetical protein
MAQRSLARLGCVCNPEQQAAHPSRYTVSMALKHIKLTIAVLWLIAIALVSILGRVSSPSGWLLLAVTAVLPPLAMMRYWHDPDQTMSERIHQAMK